MHATSLKLQIDHVILDGHGEACPDISKEAFETYKKTIVVPKLIFGQLPLG